MIKDYFKCNTCEYKENRKRGVIKCVFLSIIFCVLAFVFGVAVGMQLPARTAQNTKVTASAEEVSPTPSKWNSNWVQAPADASSYNDRNNCYILERMVSNFDKEVFQRLDAYSVTFEQTLDTNTLVVTGISPANGSFPLSDFYIDVYMSDFYTWDTPSGGVPWFYFVFTSDIYKVDLLYTYLTGTDLIVSSTNGIMEYVGYPGVGFDGYFRFYCHGKTPGETFSFQLNSFRCFVGGSVSAGSYPTISYETPNTYVCDYYYNLGLTSGGEYTEEDLQAEYNRGYAIGWQEGNDEGYYYGRIDGYNTAVDALTSDFFLSSSFLNYNDFYWIDVAEPSTLSEVSVPLNEHRYIYFSHYYNNLFDEFVEDDIVSSVNKYECAVFDSTWRMTFKNPISLGSLQTLRFANVNEGKNTFFNGYVTIKYESGSTDILTFVPAESGGMFEREYVLELNDFSSLVSVVYLEFNSSVNVVSLFSDDLQYEEDYDAGIYGVALYSTLTGDIDGTSYQLGYKNGYEEGKKVSNEQIAKENFNKGYSQGLAKAETFDFTYAVSTVVGAPIQVVKEFLNFDLLGVNMIGFISGVITLLIIIKVLKFII